MKIGLIYLLSLFFLVSCSTTKIHNNTFKVNINNSSDFNVKIDGFEVESGSQINHNFPLHDSDLYDSWNVEYRIPLTSKVTYLLAEKKFLADNQAVLKIENPVAESVKESYLVLQNRSTNPVQFTDINGNKMFPCFEKGVINNRGLEPVYSVSEGSRVVIELRENLAVLDINKKKVLPVRFERKSGYVYSVVYEHEDLKLIDARPIQNVKEKLWSIKYPENIEIYDVLEKSEKTFVLGVEKVGDAKGNLYYSGFLQCLDYKGNELWKQVYGAKGSDTYFYSMEFDEDSILIAGGTNKDTAKGLILRYGLNGNLRKQIDVELADCFVSVEKYDEEVSFSGFDSDGKEIDVNLSADNKYIKKEPVILQVQKINKTIKKEMDSKIQNISSIKKDSKGNIYISGETAYLENPVACVMKIDGETKDLTSVYVANERNSYVQDMEIDEKNNFMLISGTMNGTDSSGNNGIPYVRCLEIGSSKIVWENKYENKGYEINSRFYPCSNYGFVQVLVNANEEGNLTGPCAVVRTNSIGSANF